MSNTARLLSPLVTLFPPARALPEPGYVETHSTPLTDGRRAGRVALVAMISAIAVTSLGCVGIGGETIDLTHDELEAGSARSGHARLQTPATDLRGTKRIGRATITVFAITSGSV